MIHRAYACAAAAVILMAACGGGGGGDGVGSATHGAVDTGPPVATPGSNTPPQGIAWSTVRSGPTSIGSPTFSSVAFGNGTFVATLFTPNLSGGFIGQDQGQVFTSPDGLTWTPASTPSVDRGLIRVTFGRGRFVGYSAPGAIASSADGTTWSQTMAPTGAYWDDLLYGSGTFIASGHNSSGDRVYVTSTDGVQWTAPKTFLIPRGAFGPTLAAGGGQIIATPVENANPALALPDEAGLLVSGDGGNSWAFKPAPGVFAPAFGGGMFVASRKQGVTISLAMSSDLVNWTNTKAVAKGCTNRFAGSIFMADCGDGSMMTSIDGASWSAANFAFTTPAGDSSYMSDLAFGNGVYVLSGWPGWIVRGVPAAP